MSDAIPVPGADPALPADLRVVHVVTRYTGGSVRRVLDTVLTVPAEHIVVVGRGSDAHRFRELAGAAEVVECDDLRREVSSRDARAAIALRDVLRSVRPHVVHTHQSKGGLLGRLAARTAAAPIVYHSASMASFGPGYGRVESAAFRAAEWATAPAVDRYFVVGRDLADRLATGARVPRRKLTVVRSTIDRRRFDPQGRPGRERSRREFGLAPDDRVVAYVGSLEPRKGTTVLPAAVAQASPGAHLLVAGDGPDRDTLRIEAARLDVEVHLLGHVTGVADVMRAADVVVLPSAAEGLPQVLVQAAMVGTPFVAFEVDGVRELLDLGAAGSAVEPRDVDALARGLGRWLERGPAGAVVGDWAAWDLDVVGRQYRAAYASDLARRRH